VDQPTGDPLSFSLAWLAEAAGTQLQLGICAAGHLIVRERFCFAPVRFSSDGRSIFCEPADCDREA
jgi:hypothetical protein